MMWLPFGKVSACFQGLCQLAHSTPGQVTFLDEISLRGGKKHGGVHEQLRVGNGT